MCKLEEFMSSQWVTRFGGLIFSFFLVKAEFHVYPIFCLALMLGALTGAHSYLQSGFLAKNVVTIVQGFFRFS
jgi:hypothetical protein